MIASINTPVIVIVPGAWHIPKHYEPFGDLLKTRGYEVIVEQLLSCGSQNAFEQSVEVDAKAIRDNLLLPLINDGRDVVIVMHSFGGISGTVAAMGLSKAERLEQGKTGGVIGLAMISAFIAYEGDTVYSKIPGGQPPPWQTLFENGQIEVNQPKEIFYNDVPSSMVDEAVAALQVQSRASFESKSPPPAWPQAVYNGRRSYLVCTADECMPPIAQTMMLQHSGVEWNITEFNTGHSPFLSRPQETADWVEEQTKIFIAAK